MNFNDIKAKENQYYAKTFSRFDVCFESGKGCKLYDTEGREYTDFLAGIAVNILGYGDSELVAAISEQAQKLIHVSNLFYTQPQAELVKLLIEGSDFKRAFLCNSGAEANEGAIKLVRKYNNDLGTGRYEIITAKNSFHGRTLATAAATGQPKYSKPFEPLPAGFCYVPYNDTSALEAAVNDKTAAIMLEVLQGEGGVISATLGYMNAVRELCQKHNLLLIIDEVQTGMGRTGKLYGYQNYPGLRPDIITLAKGLAGGVPVGALLYSEKLENVFGAGEHGSTFGGNPLASAAALVVCNRLLKTDLIANCAKSGEYLRELLASLIDDNLVLGISGMGLLCGLKLSDKVNGREVVKEMLDRGFIINCAGHNTLRFAPPLIISREEIADMVYNLDISIQTVGGRI